MLNTPTAVLSTSELWKGPLRTLRAWPPLNAAVTSLGHAVMRATGLDDSFLVRHMPRVGLVQADLPGGKSLRLWSRGDDGIANLVFWRGWAGYEPESTPLFYRLAREARTVLDIGAFVGYHSVLAGLANPSGKVHSFEPLPAVFERLRRNVELNHLDNVHCVDQAVADHDGQAELITARGLASSSTLATDFLPHSADRPRVLVPLTSIDRYVYDRGLAPVDLAKIDTETTEPAVLRGMTRTLERDHPDVLCEVLPGYATGAALAAVLEPYGYRYYLLTAAGPQRVAEPRGDARWFNHLFTCRPETELPRLFP